MAIIIENASVYQHETEGHLLKDVYVIIKGSNIYKITDNRVEVEQFIKENPETILLNGIDKIVMPGFANAHTHSPMSVFRNYASDRSLHDWLFNKIIPKEQLLTDEDCYWTSLASQAEMIRGGTCAFADMYEHFESIAKAVNESGMRANLSVSPLHNIWENDKRKTVSYADKAIEYFNQYNDNNKIKVYTELHSVYLYDINMIKVNVETAIKCDTGIHIHLQETEKEVVDCIKQYGKRPIEILQELGVFKRPVIAAHCVIMNDNDIEILKKYNVNVVENVTSNLKLVSGLARVPYMLSKDINVALGTDGCASNNNLNMFEEMHISALVHKLQMKDPTSMPANKLVEMATRNGYKALGFENKAGEIKEGMLADIILVDISGINYTPINEVASAIVYNMQAGDVDTVIIDGKIVMQNKQVITIDEELVKYKVKAVAYKLCL